MNSCSIAVHIFSSVKRAVTNNNSKNIHFLKKFSAHSPIKLTLVVNKELKQKSCREPKDYYEKRSLELQ